MPAEPTETTALTEPAVLAEVAEVTALVVPSNVDLGHHLHRQQRPHPHLLAIHNGHGHSRVRPGDVQSSI